MSNNNSNFHSNLKKKKKKKKKKNTNNNLTYKGALKISSDNIISAVDDIFFPIGSKHCNTNARSV